MNTIPRAEHPRPDFMRPVWQNLNGEWQFAFDDADSGLAAGWYKSGQVLARRIQVPFCYQCKASGIGEAEHHPVLWYRRAFTLEQGFLGKRTLLRFGAVDFACHVYVNGQMAGTHQGGYIPFALDITHLLINGENDLCLRVEDFPDTEQPRGKQNWRDKWFGCWYTPVSGIWQTVYLEAVGDIYLTSLRITPDIDKGEARVTYALNRKPAAPVRAALTVSFEGRTVRRVWMEITDRTGGVTIDMKEPDTIEAFRCWTPGRPALYDLSFEMEGQDAVAAYFGMRKVEVKDGLVMLNNEPLYQRLVLDQGYWPDTLITPPSDDAIRQDIEWTLKFGYNGARKHQKVEDPRYYYWADKLGLLVWGELPSAYAFSPKMVEHLFETLAGFIERDYNHPSLICWVPLNESWGVPRIYADKRMQAASRMLYHQAYAQDGTRIVSGNDGWEQTETDILGLHDYAADGENLAAHFVGTEKANHFCDFKMTWAQGSGATGREALLVTEYGGIAFEEGDSGTWGYHDKVRDEEAFFARYQSVQEAILRMPGCQGYCYTQLTDVQQETNGLLTPERSPKVDVERFRGLTTPPKTRRA